MTEPSDVWKANAPALATWAIAHLVNRDDRHGAYGDNGPFTAPAAGPKENALNVDVLARHFAASERRDIVGVHALGADGFGKWVGWDIDAHDGDEKADPAANEKYAKLLYAKLCALSFLPLVYSSNGKGGFHAWVFFDSPAPGPLLYSFARWAVADAAAFGVSVEANPKQPSLSEDRKYGSWLRVPGRHHKREFWPVAWDADGWMTPEQTVEYILNLGGCPWEFIPEAAYPEPEPEPHREQARREYSDGGEPPWVYYNRTADFAAILKADGATVGKTKSVSRPGKDGGASATLGFKVDQESGCPLLFNWSPNWYGIPAGKFLSAFDFEVYKRHGKITADTNRLTIEALRDEGKIPPAPTRKASAPKANGVHKTPTTPAATIASPPVDESPFEFTDIGNGRRLVAECGKDIRFAADQRVFFVWDGCRWKPDPDQVHVEALAKKMLRGWAGAAADLVAVAAKDAAATDGEAQEKAKARLGRAKAELSFALKTQDLRALRRMIAAARSEPAVLVGKYSEVFDRDPWAFNAANGTIDLRNGTLRPHCREDYITKLSPVGFDPKAKAPRYLRFLNDTFAGDADLVAYIRGLAGVCITGDVSEHMLNVFHGSGSNGKGTLIETAWFPVLGEYAAKLPDTVLVNDGRDRHPTERAELAGVRLAVASETGQTGKLDEARVKELTGGDTVTARRMRQDFFQFTPTHKMILLTNHKPRIVGTDHGIWRRVRLIPFVQKFWKEADRDANPNAHFDPNTKADPTLGESLKSEAAGILADMVRHAVAFFQSRELRPPKSVSDATAAYREGEDTIGQFMSERVIPDPANRLAAGRLFQAYKAWAESLGFKPAGSRTFGEYAKNVLEHVKSNGIYYKARVIVESEEQSDLDEWKGGSHFYHKQLPASADRAAYTEKPFHPSTTLPQANVRECEKDAQSGGESPPGNPGTSGRSRAKN